MSQTLLCAYIELGESNRKHAICLAIQKQGSLTPLNDGQPVLYALQGSKKMSSPALFRKADGKLGLVAADAEGSELVYVYDFGTDWTLVGERRLPVNADGIPVKELSLSPSSDQTGYVLSWTDGKQGYRSFTSDWLSFGQPEIADGAPERPEAPIGGATATAAIPISDAECDALAKRYNKPVHIGFREELRDLNAPLGFSIQKLNLPDRVTAAYSDGSAKTFGVEWDATGVSFDKAGTYKLTGTVKQPEFANPFIRERADPYIFHDNETGYYYFTASYPTYGHDANNIVQAEGYDRLVIRRSRTLEGLATAEETEVWNEENSDVNHRYIWAPELHKIGGKWYMLCTASNSADNVWGIRPIFIPCNGDVMDPGAWSRNGHWAVGNADDGSFSTFSLDMTYFEHRDTHYVIWAEKPEGSRLYMSTVDPSAPWKLTRPRIELTAPDYAWERAHGDKIDEGPVVIKHAGKVFVFFSASTVDANYCMGYLSADESSDLMDIASWTKNPFPVLSTHDFADGQQGPGHNSFTVDELGNPVLCYHARTQGEPGDGGLDDPGRHARIKGMHFTLDGRPVLNMAAEEELLPELATLSLKVNVQDLA